MAHNTPATLTRFIVLFNGLGLGALTLMELFRRSFYGLTGGALSTGPVLYSTQGGSRRAAAEAAAMASYASHVATAIAGTMMLALLLIVFVRLLQRARFAADGPEAGGEAAESAPPPGGLPIAGTALNGVRLVVYNLPMLLRPALVPAGLYLVLSVAAAPLSGFASQSLGLPHRWSFWLFDDLAPAVALVPMLTAWYRALLSPDGRATRWLQYEFGTAERRFLVFGTVLVLGLLFVESVLLPVVVTVFQGGLMARLAWVAVMLPIAALWLRWSLVLPAAAIGAWAGFADSWRATRHNGWRMLAVHLVTALMLAPFYVVSHQISEAVAGMTVTALRLGQPLWAALVGLAAVVVFYAVTALVALFFAGVTAVIFKDLTARDVPG